jgi:hypothetical protein
VLIAYIYYLTVERPFLSLSKRLLFKHAGGKTASPAAQKTIA